MDPSFGTDALTTHLLRGEKLEAIKAYREMTGRGLAEAKADVEEIERRLRREYPDRFATPPSSLRTGATPLEQAQLLTAQLEPLLRSGQKLEAIRLYHEQTGGSLLSARTAIDGLEAMLGLGPMAGKTPSSTARARRVVVLGILLILAGIALLIAYS